MIRNITKNTILAENSIEADNFRDKLLGILVNKNLDGLILKTRFGIHTFFMRKAIDVLVLDNKNKVIVIKKNLLPNRIFIWNLQYGKVLELKEGLIHNSKTEVGDYLKF